MPRLILIILTTLCLYTVGCVTAAVPEGTLRSPEVNGLDFSASAAVSYGTLLRNAYAVPPSLQGDPTAPNRGAGEFPTSTIANTIFPFNISVDIFRRFSIFYGTAEGTGIQWQFLGEDTVDAHKGSWAASLVYSYDTDNVETSNDNATFTVGSIPLGSPGHNITNGSVSAKASIISVIAGRRMFEWLGVGLNGFFEAVQVDASGIVDGAGGTVQFSNYSNDYGLGPELYGGYGHFQFILGPVWARIEEPVRNQIEVPLFWHLRASFYL